MSIGKRKIQKELLDLTNQNEFCELEKYYSKKTIMDILNVSRNENKHSNFLAWLFKSDEEHGLGDYALKKLLETLCFIETKRKEKISNEHELIKPQKIEKIISGDYKIRDISVKREQNIEIGDKVKRLDIFIKYKIEYKTGEIRNEFIVIENKVDSSEGNGQTEDYYNWAEAYRNSEKLDDFICVYLSPQTKKEFRDYYEKGKMLCKAEKFMQINYQYLVDGVIEPCILKTESSEYKLFIENYIRCLSQPCIIGGDTEYNDSQNEKNIKKSNDDIETTIMAVGKKEKNLVKEIWDANEDILKDIIHSLSENNYMQNNPDSALLRNFNNCRKVMRPILFVLTFILDEQKYKKEIEILNAFLNNKTRLSFNNKVYKKGGKKGDSFGWLGRDMIAEHIKKHPLEKIEDFTTKVRNMQFSSPWLDEIIVREQDKNADCPKEPEHFFNETNESIDWNGEKVYVARYWTKADIFVLADLLEMRNDIKQMV